MSLSTLSQIELAGEALTDLANERMDYFDSQPNYWKFSKEGQKYDDLTYQVQTEIEEFDILINRLQDLIYEIEK